MNPAKPGIDYNESKFFFQKKFNKAPYMVVVIDSEGNFIEANDTTLKALGYTKKELSNINLRTILPEDQVKNVIGAFNEVIETGAQNTARDMVLKKKSGESITVKSFGYPIFENNKMAGMLGFAIDLTEKQKMQELLHIQHDLAFALSSVSSLAEGLKLCFNAVLEVSGMDCGGIYLFNEASDSLDLVYHYGISKEFTDKVSHYDSDESNVKLIKMGKPVYSQHVNLLKNMEDENYREGLKAIAVLPILYKNKVIGCINVASPKFEVVPNLVRESLESIAAHVGSSIVRMNTEKNYELVSSASSELPK